MTTHRATVPSVLFVCTANRCRSPLMEAYARQSLSADKASVSSAGLLESGHPMPARGVAVVRQLGIEMGQHRSKTLRPDGVAGFDLVLTAARAQAREIVAEVPGAWPRVFTLKQFTTWVQDRTWDREVPLGRWVDEAAASRPRRDLIGDSPTDDIRDPVAGSERLWREVAAEINEQLRRGLVPFLA